MAWDSSRPVPWQRLMREWVVYVGVMVVIFGGLALFGAFEVSVGAVAGLLVSGPLYLLLGAVLAKFGYQRKTLRELRAESPAPSRSSSATEPGSGPRPRPAPTRRTTTGPSQRPRHTSKQRRR